MFEFSLHSAATTVYYTKTTGNYSDNYGYYKKMDICGTILEKASLKTEAHDMQVGLGQCRQGGRANRLQTQTSRTSSRSRRVPTSPFRPKLEDLHELLHAFADVLCDRRCVKELAQHTHQQQRVNRVGSLMLNSVAAVDAFVKR